MSKRFDFIIIGQGLAGTSLAHFFLQSGKTVLLVDEERPITSSKVAAGIWNPMVFKRYTASWMAHTLLAFNAAFYPELEQKLGAKFFHPKLYYKVFTSAGDVTHWKGKLHNAEVEQFLSDEIYTGLGHEGFIAPLGAAPVLHCGYMDVGGYIKASAGYFIAQNSYLGDRFDYSLLVATTDGVEYKGYTAQKIIFCEGQYTLQNPYWGHLPFKPAKGEVITIQAGGLDAEAIVSKGVFVLPLGNDTYKVGSTYYWDDNTEQPTARGRTELAQKLEELITVPYKIIEHKAALRPTVADRRPLIGLHPQHKNIGIFNGLGTRGVLLAPYFAHHFAQHLLEGKELMDEVNPGRFI